MHVFNDFRCANGHVEEKFLDNKLRTAKCDICGLESIRVLTPIRFSLEGTSGDFPTATAHWIKKRAEKLKQEEKQADDS